MEGIFDRSSLLTCDADVGEDTLKRIYPDVRLAVPSQAAFELELVTATTPAFSAHQLRLQGASSTTVADLTETLLIAQVLGGDLRLSSGREQVTTNEPFLLPQAPVTSRWEGLTLATIALDPHAVEDYAHQLACSEGFRLRFHSHHPISASAARRWASTVEHLYRDLLPDTDAMNTPLISSEASRRLTQTLLECFPNTFMDQPQPTDGDRAVPAPVRRATAFIDAHLDQDIGVVEIAAAARLSPHGLVVAFRRHRQMTPTAYLREARDDAVRRGILFIDPAPRWKLSASAASRDVSATTSPGTFTAAGSGN